MTFHTPGPWLISKLPDPTDAKRGLGLAINNAEMPVAIVLGGGEPGNCEANARLISAAPDLLTALESLVNEPLRYSGDRIEIDCDGHADAMQRVRAARAALAKARS